MTSGTTSRTTSGTASGTPHDPSSRLDEAVAAVRDEPIDAAAERAALERVARRLAAASVPAGTAESSGSDGAIHGCDGFRALLPAHRAGALADAKRLLVEDHLRECVPCRRAARELARTPSVAAAPGARANRRFAGARVALAASVGGVVAAGVALWLAMGGAVASPTAQVRAIEGGLFVLEGDAARPLAAGALVREGEVVRTAADSRVALELADGSRVELAPRSELSLGRRRDGAVLELGRGSLIVEAAEQKSGRLYVRTDDCLVSVVGTIFSVNHGARGSRVSVLDGEVRVRHGSGGSELSVLRPGDQVATSARLDRVPLERDIAWSRNAAAYRERIAALAAVGRELDRALAVPGDRTSTRLLDLAPEGTTVYAALPNVSERLAEVWSLLEQRAAESPGLGAWWRGEMRGEHGGAEMSAALERLRAVGSELGPEVVVAASFAERDEAPVVLAEIVDRRGLEAAIDAGLAADVEAGRPHVRRIEDPRAQRSDTSETGSGRELLVWLSPQDVLVASPSAARLRQVAAALEAGRSGFVGSPFHGRLAEVYGRGAGWLLAFDAGAILARPRAGREPAEASDDQSTRTLAATGFAGLDHVVLESRTDADGVAEQHALVAFRSERRGVASWLAEPGPSGALEFVSPDAALAVAGLVKEPVEMFDDLMVLVRAGEAEGARRLMQAERELGLSLREDLAAALGGDVAVALDGPFLPQPSWKIVVETVDAGRLEHALDRLVEACAREARADGRPAPVWRQESAGGRLWRTLALEGGRDLAHFTFEDGYLLVGPSRALLADAVARRAAGATLASSRAFLDRLPADAEPDFSAVAWQNLAGSALEIAQLISGAGSALAGEERARLEGLLDDSGPMVAVAHAGADRVSLAARGARGPLGLSFESLFALAGLGRSGELAPEAVEEAAPAAETRTRTAA